MLGRWLEVVGLWGCWLPLAQFISKPPPQGDTSLLAFPFGPVLSSLSPVCGLVGFCLGCPLWNHSWTPRELHQCAIFGGPEKPKPGPSDTLGRLSVTGLSNASNRQGHREQVVLWKLGVGFWGPDVGKQS